MGTPSSLGKRGELFFGVDARHIRQLGRELVADRVTAISELIKNAYDADATRVVLSFEQASQAPGGTLSILDDGSGMTLEDIQRKWMMISTDSKEAAPVSPVYGRRRAGRKGIGRFAAETLGRRLRLDSVARGTSERTQVLFDWEKDFVAGRELGEIPNAFSTFPAPSQAHETLLTIQNLYSSWTPEVVTEVQRAILFLQPPFPVATVAGSSVADVSADPGFSVDLIFDGDAQAASSSGLRELFDSATAFISAEIDSAGNAVRRVTSERLGLDEAEVLDAKFQRAGPLELKAHYFVYKRDALGSIKARIAQQMGAEYGGVRVYRDNLRILPYGERRDDWLGLDEEYRRRSILFPIGNNNFFGEVHISRERNPDLVDTASREGIVENDAFVELRRFVFDSLVWGAQRVASIRRKKETARKSGPSPASRAAILKKALYSVRASLQESADPAALQAATEAVERLIDEAEKGDAAERAAEAELADEVELLRILASLGTSIAVFSHETRGVVDRVAAALGDVEDRVSGVLDVPELGGAHDALLVLDDLGRYIDGYVSRARVREKLTQPLAEVARQFRNAFENVINRRGIRFTVDVDPPHLRTVHMARSELESILFNLLTNSIKAMDREGHLERAIHLSARASGSEAVLRFEDTGSGIDEELKDRIFDAFFTTTRPEESDLGTGTGLGLRIVADTLDAYKGSIRVAAPSKGFVTCFEIRIPLALGA